MIHQLALQGLRSAFLALAMGALLITVGCQKKCQQPAATNFKTITGQEWRLVETTDPSPEFKKLSKSTFLIFTFDVTYSGSILKVLNNLKFEGPAKVFNYEVDSETGKLRIEYKDPPTEENQTTAEEPGEVVDYSYELGKELELYDSKAGHYYRFIPFSAVVAPDDTCEF